MLLSLAALSVASAAPLDPMDYAPLDVLFQPSEDVDIDTTGPAPSLLVDGTPRYTGVVSGGVAVFAFGDIVIDDAITVTVAGDLPLALLAQGRLDMAGTLDGSAAGERGGPGGHDGGQCGPGAGPGGGASGEGGGGGGFGGRGGNSDYNVRGGDPYGDLLLLLEGGSGGGADPSGPGCDNPLGGGGGGAIELGARTLEVSGDVLADGAAGQDHNDPYEGDGGGGGAGGGILLHAFGGGICTGELFVQGGDGGNARSSTRSDGGGGGGGRLVLVGVDASGCTDHRTGGEGASSGFVAADNGLIGARSVIDPDDDGDQVQVLAGGDCDDRDPAVYPGAPEVACDGIDQDCDGSDLVEPDNDRDGYGGCDDCDDDNDAVYPGAPEVAGDGIDQDCDGEDLPADPTGTTEPGTTEPTSNGGDDDDGDDLTSDRGTAVRERGLGAPGCRCDSPGAPGGAPALALALVAALLGRRSVFLTPPRSRGQGPVREEHVFRLTLRRPPSRPCPHPRDRDRGAADLTSASGDRSGSRW